MFVVGGVLLLIAHRRLGSSKATAEAPEARNPLRFGSAIATALGFQAVLMILELFRGQFGDPGVYASAALAGLTDMDALTFSMSRLAEDAALVPVAARALLLGVIVNTLFKCAVALVLGAPTYRRLAVPGLLLLAAAGGAGLWLAALR